MDSKELGSLGGKARAAKLSPEERSRIASDAATARWSGVGRPPKGSNALIAKFPDFNPEWDEKTREIWFAAFNKLMVLCTPKE